MKRLYRCAGYRTLQLFRDFQDESNQFDYNSLVDLVFETHDFEKYFNLFGQSGMSLFLSQLIILSVSEMFKENNELEYLINVSKVDLNFLSQKIQGRLDSEFENLNPINFQV